MRPQRSITIRLRTGDCYDECEEERFRNTGEKNGFRNRYDFNNLPRRSESIIEKNIYCEQHEVKTTDSLNAASSKRRGGGAGARSLDVKWEVGALGTIENEGTEEKEEAGEGGEGGRDEENKAGMSFSRWIPAF